MRKRTLGVVLLAGLAMSGAGAFTGSNTFSGGSGTQTAGYGSVTATGITVKDVDYNLLTADASKMDSVVFTTATNVVSGYTMRMTLRNASDAVVSTTTCSGAAELILAVPTGDYLITCDISPDAAITSFDSVGLSVVSVD